jgi:hypothetical protein
MNTAVADRNDLYAESAEARRPVRTIKLYILGGWIAETGFLIFGAYWFPQLHPPLIPRLLWTQLLCGIGMGAAAGAMAYLLGAAYKQGSRAALILTAIGAGGVFVACANVCYFVDGLQGMDYFGRVEDPFLFWAKGNFGGALIGIAGSWLLNTKKGLSILNKVPFLR